MHILVLIIVIILLIFLVGKLLEDVAGGVGIVGYAIVKAAQGIASLFKKASSKEKAEKPPRPPKQPKRPAPAEGPTTITVRCKCKHQFQVTTDPEGAWHGFCPECGEAINIAPKRAKK